jgi:hypothetical protein
MATEGPMGAGMEGMDPAELARALGAMRERVMEGAAQLAQQLELERRLKENPWPVLGVAAGAGFLLGGGLWPVLRPLAKGAARAMMSPTNLLAVAAAFGAMRPGEEG